MSRDFNPILCQCESCDTILQSSFPGEFVACECGHSFVDQHDFYSRYGGLAKSVESLILRDFTALSGVYSSMDVLELISDIMVRNSIDGTAYDHYQASNTLLGGASLEYFVNTGKGYKAIAFLEAALEVY